MRQQFTLSYWDTQTLQYLLQWLDTKDVLRLLQTEDRLLTHKLHMQISSLHFGEKNLELSTEDCSLISTVGQSKWPALLTHPSPLHRLTTLRFDNMKYDVRCDLSALPPTLTKLIFIDVTLIVHTFDALLFCLPNLDHLRLDHIMACLTADNLRVPLADTWISLALRKSPSLRVFRYTPFSIHESYNVDEFINMMPALEKLSLPYLTYSINSWPVHLHTLCFHKYFGKPSSQYLTIPDSVKTLIIKPSLSADVTCRILKSAPSTLTCLEANLLNVRGNASMKEIARFTQLQSLHLPRGAALNGIFGVLPTCGLSMLPQSITALSEAFAVQPSSWQYIPRRATLMNRKRISSTKPSISTVACTFDVSKDEAYLPYFPNGLRKISLIDSNVPVANTSLQSIEMTMHRLDGFSRLECANLLTNMPRTLTSLQILMISAPSLVWLDGFGETSEVASERFPCLTSLSLSLWGGLSEDQDVCAWLTHLPHTLVTLHLEMSKLIRFEPRPIEFATVVLPPNLTELRLRLRNFLIDLPAVLPSRLVEIHLEFYAYIDATYYKHVLLWPATLRKRHVRCLCDDKLDDSDDSGSDDDW